MQPKSLSLLHTSSSYHGKDIDDRMNANVSIIIPRSFSDTHIIISSTENNLQKAMHSLSCSNIPLFIDCDIRTNVSSTTNEEFKLIDPKQEDNKPSTASTNNRRGGIFRVGHRRLSDQNRFINIFHLNKDNNLQVQESCNNLWKKISNDHNAVKVSVDNHNNSNMTDPNMIQRIFIRNNNQNCNNTNNEAIEESENVGMKDQLRRRMLQLQSERIHKAPSKTSPLRRKCSEKDNNLVAAASNTCQNHSLFRFSFKHENEFSVPVKNENLSSSQSSSESTTTAENVSIDFDDSTMPIAPSSIPTSACNSSNSVVDRDKYTDHGNHCGIIWKTRENNLNVKKLFNNKAKRRERDLELDLLLA